MKIFSSLFKKKSNGTTLILNSKGINKIGGKANKRLQIPELETSPIVYFGCISKNETALELIDFDFH